MGYRLLSNQRWLFSVTAAAAKRGRAALCWLGLIVVLTGCAAGVACDPSSLTSCLTCAPGTADCNRSTDDGCEVNTQLDPSHCGRCDKACPGVGQQRALCEHGQCALCPSGRQDCNQEGADGCETKVSSDPLNCGLCDVVCPPVRNGVAGCINSSCTIARCQQGFEDCDGNPLDGCETDTRADPRNCGGCGVMCATLPNAQVGCLDGACVVAMCNDGYDSCDRQSPILACQTNLNTDEYNCGDCATVCPPVAGLARTCVLGQCSSKPCDTRWKDCNAKATDGCETDTQQDGQNCGGCNVRCSPSPTPNSQYTCQQGSCVFSACAPGYGDCNNSLADGCEVNVATTAANCGACNNACVLKTGVAAVACQSSKCAITQCTVGLTDCDGQYNNGCEANLSTDNSNCGACGHVCNASQHALPACVSGLCQITTTCETGYANCDSNLANGCETTTLTDQNHCGSCSTKCTSGQFCSNGKCVP